MLDDGKLAYLAVHSRRGPHVTPLTFQHRAGRLWIVTARSSVKARAVAGHPAVGALVPSGELAVMCAGRARVVDPLVDPLALRSLGPGLLDLPLAMAGYLLRNVRTATAAVRERPAATLPIARVLLVVDLTSVALLQGWSVVAAWGPWAHRDLMVQGAPPPGRAPPAGRLPGTLRGLLSGSPGAGALGWQTLSGPMAIPARWEPDGPGLMASAPAMTLAGGAPRSSCCFAIDRGGRPSGPPEGFVLRGRGSARVEGQAAHVLLEAARVTCWAGTRTRTIALGRRETR